MDKELTSTLFSCSQRKILCLCSLESLVIPFTYVDLLDVHFMYDLHFPPCQTLYTDANSYRELLAKTPQDGIEMLDSMLVDADRTLSEQQKNAVLNSLTSCWSPVYVNILFHKAKSWRGNELVSLPSKVALALLFCLFCLLLPVAYCDTSSSIFVYCRSILFYEIMAKIVISLIH